MLPFISFTLFLLSLYLLSFGDFIGDNYCIVAHLEQLSANCGQHSLKYSIIESNVVVGDLIEK